MTPKKMKERITLLEDLCNAQQELLLIYDEIITPIDAADHAFASIVDPFDGQMVGTDLHEIRSEYMDRELELGEEIQRYYDVIEGKPAEPVKDPQP